MSDLVVVATGRHRDAKINRLATTATATRHLVVGCWCERVDGLVTADRVRAGLTFSCGRPDCRP